MIIAKGNNMRLNWQLTAAALSKDVCEEIINNCKTTCSMIDATTFNQDTSARKTKVGWTVDSRLVNIVEKYALEANRRAFNFIVDYLPPIQFGEYVEGGHYSWHHDVQWENPGFYDRKISIVIQLSDPATYTGGDFEFKEVETPTTFKAQGSVLVFPSYLQHRVTPITSGTRYSLVGWMEGPRWR